MSRLHTLGVLLYMLLDMRVRARLYARGCIRSVLGGRDATRGSTCAATITLLTGKETAIIPNNPSGRKDLCETFANFPIP